MPKDDISAIREQVKTINKKRTNADGIRSWSDEEIAEFTIGVMDGVFTLLTGEKMPNDKREEMKTHWLNWLQQEVE